MTEAFIYDAVRSPRGKGRSDGSLHEITALDLASQVLASVNDRNGLEGHEVEDVAVQPVLFVAEKVGKPRVDGEQVDGVVDPHICW